MLIPCVYYVFFRFGPFSSPSYRIQKCRLLTYILGRCRVKAGPSRDGKTSMDTRHETISYSSYHILASFLIYGARYFWKQHLFVSVSDVFTNSTPSSCTKALIERLRCRSLSGNSKMQLSGCGICVCPPLLSPTLLPSAT